MIISRQIDCTEEVAVIVNVFEDVNCTIALTYELEFEHDTVDVESCLDALNVGKGLRKLSGSCLLSNTGSAGLFNVGTSEDTAELVVLTVVF